MAMNDHINAERADATQAGLRARRAPLDPTVTTERSVAAQAMAAEGTPAPERRRVVDRKPFGAAEQQLAYPPIAGYRLYWFNDTPGRIARALSAGYEHVADHDGSPVRRNVGRGENGGGMTGYLMKIPIEWYYEDMASAQEQLARRLSDIKEGRHGAVQGQNQYVPAQGIKIEERR